MSGRTEPSRSTSSPASSPSQDLAAVERAIVDLDLVELAIEPRGPVSAGTRALAGDEVGAVRDHGGVGGGAAGGEDAVDKETKRGSLAREREQVERGVVHGRRRRSRVVIGGAGVLVELGVHRATGIEPVVPEARVLADQPFAEHALELAEVVALDPIADREVGDTEVAHRRAERHQIIDAVEAEGLSEPARGEGSPARRSVGIPGAVLGVAVTAPVVDEIGGRVEARGWRWRWPRRGQLGKADRETQTESERRDERASIHRIPRADRARGYHPQMARPGVSTLGPRLLRCRIEERALSGRARSR